MKLLLLSLILLAACGKKETVSIINGKDGKDGANGHSLVSQYVDASECLDGGTRLDIALDLNDSLSIDEGDLYQGSLIACNGEQGITGEMGEIGPQGFVGETGEIGPQGLPGEIGPIGPSGSQGIQGLQGPAGLPASSCTLVFKANNGNNGKKYTLTCGSTSVIITADNN